jgi:histone deacetylase complex subunit SAP18
VTKDLGSIVLRAETDEGRGELPSEASVNIVTDGPMSGRLEGDPERTLQDARFVIGDYVSCAIFPPGANGEVAAPLPPARGPRERGGRENGYGGGRGGGYRGGAYGRGSSYGRLNDGSGGLPQGEWRRGERLPDGPGGRGFGRPRDRGW